MHGSNIWGVKSKFGVQERKRKEQLQLVLAILFRSFSDEESKIKLIAMLKVHLIEYRSYEKKNGEVGHAYGALTPDGKAVSFSSDTDELKEYVHPAFKYDETHAIEVELQPSVFRGEISYRHTAK